MRTKDFKLIEYQLYKYKSAEERIKEIEDEYIWKINGSNQAWLRGINNDENTFEEQVQKMIDDKKINKVKKWQEFIKGILAIFYVKKRTYYQFIKLRYFDLISDAEIMEYLGLDNKTFMILKEKVIFSIYLNALKENMIDI